MRLPFFKSTKADPNVSTKVLATPPRFAAAPAGPPPPPKPTTAATNPEADTATLTIFLSALLDQLPAQLFVAQPPQPLESVSFDVPVNLVLPRLRTGRLDVPLSELLRYVPSEFLRQPLPHFHESQTVTLPLAEVIEALPPELLQLTHESEIKADDPALDELPKLIDDTLLQEPPPAAEPAAAPAAAPEPKQKTAVTTSAPAPKAPATLRSSDIPEHVVIRLQSLLASIPDNALGYPRAELSRHANLESQALIPTEPILPQLKSGSAKVPLSIVLSTIPRVLLANPMPNPENQKVSLPLAEIVPQLPARLFTEQLRDSQPQEFEAVETNFPDPFRERSAPEPEPQPMTPPFQEQLEAEPCFTDAALSDEGLTVFAEKQPPAPLPVVEQVSEPARAPEPVAEVAAPAEPIAEVVPAPFEAGTEAVVEVPPAPVVPETAAPAALEPAEVIEPVAETTEQLEAAKTLVNLNKCTEEDLVLIEGVGPALARRIIDFREANGQFSSVDELRRIPGVGRKVFGALTGTQPRALNRMLGAPHNNELTLQEIVALTGKLPGVDGCMLALADGLFLAGQLPAHLNQDTVSVFAPQLFKKVGRYARELKLGQITRFTIFTETQPISIFRAGDVYLVVVHDTVHFSKALLRRCERISKELARLCRQRAVA